MQHAAQEMQAMVFAAGLGTRLRPLTDTRPKALVEVRGVTLLLRTLRTLQGAGARRIVVNVHHYADMIRSYLADNENFGLDIAISDESEHLLDTGGGIRRAASLFDASKPVLIHNVDILSNADLGCLYACIGGDDAALLVSERPSSRYLLFDDDMLLVGWTNVETGALRTPHRRLDAQRCRRFAFAGIHVVARSALDAMQSWPERFSIIDFYLDVCATMRIRGHLQDGLVLTDVGKIETLERLNASGPLT